ncbi:unnamed protein product [Gemmata massiliana]|uniref:Uncharacterized protein n=1 Tax=Gemmata massiliana TaxID=1210884 RepID=A0A6P2DK03_9BACT|nr:hypothetical protein [Gemmata massiliana]VTS00830.1 unnamed protein product [Gemmata massiliana]
MSKKSRRRKKDSIRRLVHQQEAPMPGLNNADEQSKESLEIEKLKEEITDIKNGRK